MGLDAFIKYWIAIETIGMPDESNVKPANRTLAKIYDMTLQEVVEKFKLGRLQDFRSRVLHHGEDLTVHQDLSQYIEYLFTDLVLAFLELPAEKKAIKMFDKPSFNILNLVKYKINPP